MVSSKVVLSLSAIFIFTVQAVAELRSPYCICDQKGNYTANSTYEANLNHLLPSLYANTKINYGYYNSSYGQNSDKVYAIGLCRGDVKPDFCRSCLGNATSLVRGLCPSQKEAIGGDDYCMIRYSNRSISGVEDLLPIFHWSSPNNISAAEVTQFNQDLRTLFESLMNQAAVGGSLRKFAANNATGPSFETIYALVQCIPDLSNQNCSDCLRTALAYIPRCCDRKKGGRVLVPSCNIRFEENIFYDSTAIASPAISPPTPSANTNTTEAKKSNTSKTVTIITVPIVAFVVLVISIFVYFRARRPTRKVEIADEIGSVESLQFDFGTIRIATNNSSEENKIGQGGFGAVYKGKLSDGQIIAVKRLSRNSGQGDLEFKNEVLLVTKLQHRNLVRLLGFCLEGNERLLVYEFVPNASLSHFLFDIVTGQRNNCFRNGENAEDLLSYAWKNWRDGTASNTVDPTLRLCLTNEVMRCIHFGLLCVQEKAANRPTMASVVLMLNSPSSTLPAPSEPAFFMDGSINSGASRWKHNIGLSESIDISRASANEASVSELYPR